MEIKVNDYVRTKTGNITKVIKVKDTVIWTDDFIDGHGRYHEGVIEKTDIVKHSNNIIDLIECGDIITHYDENCLFKEEVWRIYKEKNIIYTIDGTEVNIKNIKSIVTKEQFSSLEYII